MREDLEKSSGASSTPSLEELEDRPEILEMAAGLLSASDSSGAELETVELALRLVFFYAQWLLYLPSRNGGEA